jgi:hypothetical protein
MGLFKKKQTVNNDMMDIPPPPPMEGFSQDNSIPLPDAPQFGEQAPLPPDQQIPGMDDFPLPPMPEENQNMLPPEQETRNAFEIPPIKAKVNSEAPKAKKPSAFESLKEEATPEEHHDIKSANFSAGNNTFIEVGKYRQILRELDNIKKSIKVSNDEVNALVNEINEEEKVFASLNNSLTSIEKKLSQLDETIFNP